MLLVSPLVDAVTNALIRRRCRREFELQQAHPLNERAVEYRFVFAQLARYCPATVLDVGTGATALPQLLRTCGCQVTAIDNIRDYWRGGMVNRHYHVLDQDITQPTLTGTFQLITCVSVLEHVTDHGAAFRHMSALLAPGGHLIVTCPFNAAQYCPNVYALPESSVGAGRHPFVTQAYSQQEVAGWLATTRLALVAQEYWRCFTGPYWTTGEQLKPFQQVRADEPHQHSCLLFEKPLK